MCWCFLRGGVISFRLVLLSYLFQYSFHSVSQHESGVPKCVSPYFSSSHLLQGICGTPCFLSNYRRISNERTRARERGRGGEREIRDTESESERDRKTDSERGASEREREMESQRDGEQGDALSSAHCNSHYSWRASKERKRNMTVVFFAMVVFS